MTDLVDPRTAPTIPQGVDATCGHLTVATRSLQLALSVLVSNRDTEGCDQVLAQISAVEAAVRRLRIQLSEQGERQHA